MSFLLVRSIFCYDREQFIKSCMGIMNTVEGLGNGNQMLVIGYCGKFRKEVVEFLNEIVGKDEEKDGGLTNGNDFKIANEKARKITNTIVEENARKMTNEILDKPPHDPSISTNCIKSILWDVNYGKYKIINTISKLSANYKAIFYCDHDIRVEITQEILKYLYKQTYYCGLLALNQIGDNRHQNDIYSNYHKSNLVYPNITGSIATGCFMIGGEVMSKVELKEVAVYGLDDYYLANFLGSLGYIPMVILDYHCIHPYDMGNDYKEWKRELIRALISPSPPSYSRTMELFINLLTQ